MAECRGCGLGLQCIGNDLQMIVALQNSASGTKEMTETDLTTFSVVPHYSLFEKCIISL